MFNWWRPLFPADELRRFTMLVGIALSNVPSDYAGNLTVWPGTHHLYAQYFCQNGHDILMRHGAEGMPPIDMPRPQMLTARAGDAFFVHYQIAHCASPNVSPHPRYAIYFRLRHVNLKAQLYEALTDIWLEWDGMREIVAQYKETQPVKPR